MEPSVVPLLRTYNTAKVLVTAINKQQGHQRPKRPLTVSIYIQDQVAAVLANMAANVECRSEVVKHGGLPLLLQFLLAQSSAVTSSDLKPEDYAQIAATERVLQKSAIAISRYIVKIIDWILWSLWLREMTKWRFFDRFLLLCEHQFFLHRLMQSV